MVNNSGTPILTNDLDNQVKYSTSLESCCESPRARSEIYAEPVDMLDILGSVAYSMFSNQTCAIMQIHGYLEEKIENIAN